MNLKPLDAISFSGAFRGDRRAGRGFGQDDEDPEDGPSGAWESSTELTPEMRLQTRRGFRGAAIPIGPGQFLVTVIPDYGTNLLDAAANRLQVSGFGAWGLESLIPKGIRSAARNSFKAVVPKQLRPVFQSVVDPAYATQAIYKKIPARMRKLMPAIARQAAPLALQAAMQAGLSTLMPQAAAPGLMATLQKALPGLLSSAGGQGAAAPLLAQLKTLLPQVQAALPAAQQQPDVAQLLSGFVEQALPGQMESIIPGLLRERLRDALPARMLRRGSARGNGAAPAPQLSGELDEFDRWCDDFPALCER